MTNLNPKGEAHQPSPAGEKFFGLAKPSDLNDKNRHIINTDDFSDVSKSLGLDKRVGPSQN